MAKALKEGDLKEHVRGKEPGDLLSWAYQFPPHPFQKMPRLKLSFSSMSRDYKGNDHPPLPGDPAQVLCLMPAITSLGALASGI